MTFFFYCNWLLLGELTEVLRWTLINIILQKSFIPVAIQIEIVFNPFVNESSVHFQHNDWISRDVSPVFNSRFY